MLINLNVPGLRDGLYHKDVYMPEIIKSKLPDEIDHIIYTNHAIETARQRNINLPNRVCGGVVFEVEVERGKIIKAGYCIRHFKNTNLCLVMFLHTTKVVCGTAWLNFKDSKKFKLNTSRYVKE